MLRKEFNEVLRQSLFFVSAVVGVTVLLSILSLVFGWAVTFGEFFVNVYGIAVGIYAVVTGVTLFTTERKQRGIEYLLTLPLSRARLLWVKIMPRFVALVVFALLYLPVLYVVSGGRGADAVPTVPPFFLFYGVFMLFFISVSLSAAHDNFVLLIIGTLFIVTIHSFFIISVLQSALWKLFDRFFLSSALHAVVLAVVGLLIPFLTAFFVSFKKFDVNPRKRFNRIYLKVFVPMLVIGLLLSFVYAYAISYPNYKSYCLTKDHQLIESDWDSSRIYDKDTGEVTELDTPFMAFFPEQIESGGYIYNWVYLKPGYAIIRVNMASKAVETLYKFKLIPPFHSRGNWLYGKTLACFDGGYHEDNVLVLIDVDTKAVKKIKIYGNVPTKNARLWLFGADENDGKRFWLLASERFAPYPVFRVWEDGTIEELVKTVRKPGYFNGMLITLEKDGMVFSRLSPDGCEEIKRVPSGRNVVFQESWIGTPYLDNRPQKEIYGIRFGKELRTLMKIDLENLEVTKVIETESIIRWFSPEECYLFDNYRNPGKFYRVQSDGQLTLLRDFTGFDGQKSGNRFQLTRNGVILRENEKITVYAFPELKELIFKDLK